MIMKKTLHSFREQLIVAVFIIFALLFGFSAYIYSQVSNISGTNKEVVSVVRDIPYEFSQVYVLLLKQEENLSALHDELIAASEAEGQFGELSKSLDDEFAKISSLQGSLLDSRWSSEREKKLFEQADSGLVLIKKGKNDFEQKFINFLAAYEQGDAASKMKLLSEARAIALSAYSRIDFLNKEFSQAADTYSLTAEGSTDNLLRVSFIFLIIILLIVFAVSGSIILRTSYSLKSILEGIGQFHAGRFRHKIVLKSKNEFGMIAESLNEAVVNLDKSLDEAKKLSRLVESSMEGIAVTDTEGVIQYVNSAWEKLTGWKSEEVAGKVTPRVLKSGKQNQEFYEKLWKTIKSGKIFRVEMANKRKDHSLYDADEVIMPLIGSDGKINSFAAFQRDITDQKRADRERQELNGSREAFIRNTAHGLRTPLSAIGYTFEILMDKVAELPPWTHQFLVGAREHYAWMRDILENFIFIQELTVDYFRRKDAKVSLQAELSAITDHTRWFAGSKNITFEWFNKDIPESLPIDRAAFIFVVKQLLDNALIFTRPHGKITFATYQDDGRLVLEVSDTGVGIPKDDQPHIFSSFFRGRNAYEMKNVGMGIGLYLVKMIAEGYGGDAAFHSTEGKGSTFVVRFPLTKRE